MHRFLSPILIFAGSITSYAGACPAWERLPVKLFNDAGTEPAILNAAKSEAGWLVKSLCIEVAWVPCPLITVTNAVPCQAPPGAIELHVLSDTASSDPSANSLGISIPKTGASRAAVFLERVRELAAANEGIIDAGGLLGHVMAHEIGHLLLRSTAHSSEGIMRAEFRRSDLKKAAQRQFRFTPEQVESIRRTAYSRGR